MCYHMSQTFKKITKKVVKERYGVNHSDLLIFSEREGHHLNGFAHPTVLIVASNDPSSLQALEWGLIPAWVKDFDQAKKLAKNTLNAKSETIFELPSFREAITSRRCIIPIDGFYEWLHHRNKTYPHYIYPKDETVFSLGGIWDEWIDKGTGELKRTFSIVTTAANEVMDQIHNTKKRMPLILDPKTELDWLSPELKKEDINNLMHPYDPEQMAYHTVSRLVTSRSGNSDVTAVKRPLSYPELHPTLF